MAKNENEKTVTVEDVVAEAEKTNLLHEAKKIPTQATSDETLNNSQSDDTEDEPKKSLKDRLKAAAEKLKANKKGVIITLAVVGAATVAVVKFSAKTMVEEIVESSTEEAPADVEKNDDSTPDA